MVSFIRRKHPPVERKYTTPSGRKVALSEEERPKQVVAPDKPGGIKLERHELWCPYCARVTKFRRHYRLDLCYCERCGISDRDFYVRKANNLWKK